MERTYITILDSRKHNKCKYLINSAYGQETSGPYGREGGGGRGEGHLIMLIMVAKLMKLGFDTSS